MIKPENNLKKRRNKIFRPLRIKSITFSENKIKAANWVHVFLWILLGTIVFFSIVNIVQPNLLWLHFSLTDYPLHSTVESLGAIAAILIAFMPLHVLFGKHRPSFVFLSTGFLVMGLLDLFHSFYKIGHGFVFTHAVALLAGGFFFVLFIFPWKLNVDKSKKYFLFFSTLITILFAVVASLNRDAFPEMIQGGVFTPAANATNLIAGILFSISAIKLIILYVKEKNIGVLILIFTAVSSAIVGITFQYSVAWSDSWWLWHAVRLIAFLTVLSYMFWRIQAISTERNLAIQSFKEKHNQLQASEERFSLVNEATMQGLWDWNVPKNEVYFSPVWKMQVGYKDDELENDFNNWVKLLHPGDKDRCLKAVDDYLKNPEGKFILEFRFRHKNGHYVWIHNQAASVKDKDGNVLRMFGAHTDITAQKEAEEKLRDSEKQFRIIFENSPLGKSRTGLDGSLNINKSFSDITGYNLEELKQKNWKEITHPNDIKESEEIIQDLISGKKQSANFEKRYLHKQGHYVWTEVNTALHRNEAGEPQFFITAISDISKRKRTEQEKEQALKALNKRMKEITCLFDINEAIKNPRVNVKEVMEMITRAIPKGWQNPERTNVKIVLDGREYESENYKESEEWIEEKIIVDGNQRGKVQVFIKMQNSNHDKLHFQEEEKKLLKSICDNIGIYIDRVENEKELQQTAEDLKRSNKELEQFAYVASHDLQEPL